MEEKKKKRERTVQKRGGAGEPRGYSPGAPNAGRLKIGFMERVNGGRGKKKKKTGRQGKTKGRKDSGTFFKTPPGLRATQKRGDLKGATKKKG